MSYYFKVKWSRVQPFNIWNMWAATLVIKQWFSQNQRGNDICILALILRKLSSIFETGGEHKMCLRVYETLSIWEFWPWSYTFFSPTRGLLATNARGSASGSGAWRFLTFWFNAKIALNYSSLISLYYFLCTETFVEKTVCFGKHADETILTIIYFNHCDL